MKMKTSVFLAGWIALFFLLINGCRTIPPVKPSIEPSAQQTQTAPEVITVNVSIKTAPGDLNAFGFEVWFDPQEIQFVKFDRGDLIQDRFKMFAMNEVKPGKLRIGGIETDLPIRHGESGILAKLQFKALKKQTNGWKLNALVDDLKGWSVKAGPCPQEDEFSGLALCE